MAKIYRSSQSVRQSGRISGGRKNKKSYIFLILLLVSNLIFLVPFETVLILALSGIKLDESVFHWLTVLILPLNSISNPLLYTVRIIVKKYAKEKVTVPKNC